MMMIVPAPYSHPKIELENIHFIRRKTDVQEGLDN